MKKQPPAGQFIQILALALLFGGSTSPAVAAASAPDWLTEAAAKPASFPYRDAATATLLDDLHLDVAPDGAFTQRTRGVIRILTIEGRQEARAVFGYNSDSTRVTSFKAWLIRPSGPVLTYGKNKIVETAAFGTQRELYSAGRKQHISAVDDALPGAVFAWEIVRVEKDLSCQRVWSFAGRSPVELSRITVRVPPGWQVEPRVFNHPGISPTTTNGATSWELRQLPPVRREPFAPALRFAQPQLGLDIKPPATGNNSCRKPLFSWSAIAAYLGPLYEKAATPSPEIKAKANELVAGATTLADRIARLCAFAQQTTYISILLDADEGGGMIPQPAEKVFRHNYGDCKDKATLLSALLRTQGIESFPVIVYSGDSMHVRPEWASTGQFNHCILAIKVDDTIDGPALLVHPTRGRFMIFDPTSAYVAFGALPKSDSGGYGLFLSGSDGELLKLPAIETSKSSKTIAYRLNPDGSLTGTMERTSSGPISEQIRAEHRSLSRTDFQKNQQKLLQQTMPNAEVSRLETTDDFERGSFRLKMDVSANAYGKPMRDTLLVFKPAVFSVGFNMPNSRSKRSQPIRFNPAELTETTQILLPAGYTVDELPADTQLQSVVGSYRSSIQKTKVDELVLTRTFTLKEIVAPAENYREIVQFAEKIQEAEQSPVVLKRK